MDDKICTWTLPDEDDNYLWETDCGWTRIGDWLDEDGEQFADCPYCHKPLLKEIKKGIFSFVSRKKEK